MDKLEKAKKERTKVSPDLLGWRQVCGACRSCWLSLSQEPWAPFHPSSSLPIEALSSIGHGLSANRLGYPVISADWGTLSSDLAYRTSTALFLKAWCSLHSAAFCPHCRVLVALSLLGH